MKKSLLLLSSLFVLSNVVSVVAQSNDVAEIIEQREKDYKDLEEVELFTGNWLVGTDVPAGRYEITGDGSGNFFVRNESGSSVVNEILDNADDWGVPSITVNLEEGHEIEISGLNAVYFTPYETELRESLGTGTWIVGVDIKEGSYIATTEAGSGNFFVRSEKGGKTKVNEILDSEAEWGVDKIALNLEDGQEIEISGLSSVDFTAR